MLEKTLESPLDCKEIKPINPKGNQSWIFIGRTDAEATILLPPNVKNQLIRKDPDAGKDWRQEEKGTTEDKMVAWHHRLNGHEFGWAPGVGDGQGGLAYCSSWGRKELDTTERLNWTELKYVTMAVFFCTDVLILTFKICFVVYSVVFQKCPFSGQRLFPGSGLTWEAAEDVTWLQHLKVKVSCVPSPRLAFLTGPEELPSPHPRPPRLSPFSLFLTCILPHW